MLVDSHCHINCLEGGVAVAQDYLDRARAVGVEHFLCVSIDWETYPDVLSIAQSHQDVSASVGVHPNAQGGVEPTVDMLAKEADHEKVIAIGETGLDYYRQDGGVEWQRERFRQHIHAAKLTKKPLIIHTREAREDTIKILQEENAAEVGGVMHCFTETWEMAQAAIAMNFYISFSGIVTFKSAKSLQDVARKMPLDRMLIETDSPYLAPAPHRGKSNEPAYVAHVAEYIAGLRESTVEDIGKHTTENFYTLFG